MKALRLIVPVMAVAALLALSAGCASKPTYKHGFDFGRFHTFALLPLPTTGSYEDPGITTRLGPVAQESAVATLQAKGFKQVPEAQADFLVKMLFDWQPEQGRTEQRFFDIQILDAKTKEVVWSKYAFRVTDRSVTPAVARATVAEMLQPFPPGGHAAGH